MKKIIIQKEIRISQKEIDEIIESYKKLPKTYQLCMGTFSGDKDKIIKEIKKLSKIGKIILLADYEYKKWLEKQKIKNQEVKNG